MRSTTDVLVIADDLSGAADSGVPFALRGMRTEVLLGVDPTPGAPLKPKNPALAGNPLAHDVHATDTLGDNPLADDVHADDALADDPLADDPLADDPLADDPLADDVLADVVVVDTDSRHLEAEDAAAAVREAVRAYGAGRLVYKKIDSTLRGNLAAELGALPGPVVVCPASPATGRTVLDGVVHIDGVPLPETAAWATEPGPPPPTVAAALTPLPVRTITLPTIRGPRHNLRHTLHSALAQGSTPVVVCDAVTEADLLAIAETCLDLGGTLAGAAGLARALAECLPADGGAGGEAGAERPVAPVVGTALVMVGSAHAVSHAQAHHLAGVFPSALRMALDDLLDPAARTELAARLADLAGAGDTVVSIAAPATTTAGAGEGVAGGSAVVAREVGVALGEAVGPAAWGAGLLVLTGGETARSVLTRLGMHRLELLAEPEPGVVLAAANDAHGRRRHVLTKAGGFGRPATLDLAIQAVRKGPQ